MANKEIPKSISPSFKKRKLKTKLRFFEKCILAHKARQHAKQGVFEWVKVGEDVVLKSELMIEEVLTFITKRGRIKNGEGFKCRCENLRSNDKLKWESWTDMMLRLDECISQFDNERFWINQETLTNYYYLTSNLETALDQRYRKRLVHEIQKQEVGVFNLELSWYREILNMLEAQQSLFVALNELLQAELSYRVSRINYYGKSLKDYYMKKEYDGDVPEANITKRLPSEKELLTFSQQSLYDNTYSAKYKEILTTLDMFKGEKELLNSKGIEGIINRFVNEGRVEKNR